MDRYCSRCEDVLTDDEYETCVPCKIELAERNIKEELYNNSIVNKYIYNEDDFIYGV